MSYVKTTWKDGDVITAEKLNKIENGIEAASGGGGGGSFLVTITWDDTTSKYVSDKTYAEIKAAFESGQSAVAFCDPNIYELIQVDSGFIRFASNTFDFASSTNTLILMSDTFKVLSDDSVTEDYINVKWNVTNNA